MSSKTNNDIFLYGQTEIRLFGKRGSHQRGERERERVLASREEGGGHARWKGVHWFRENDLTHIPRLIQKQK